MSTRPRPRPKPRARIASVPPPSSLATDTPGATSESVSLHSVVINIDDDDDDDARFFKNRNRTLQSWKKLDKLAEVQDVKKAKQIFDANEDDLDATPRRKHRVDNDSMPSWTKNAKAAIVSSDEDSDGDILEIIATSSSTTLTGRRAVDPSKRKRSRSRSLTPPPSLPSHTIQYARETVRRLLGSNVRAASPTFTYDDSFDNIQLDPELAKIAMEAKRQTSNHPSHSRSISPEQLGGGPEVVTLKVRWKKHPLNPEGKTGVWAFQMKRHDSFSILFSEVADIAGILVDSVIVTYEGKRIFSSASPHGIGVWAQAELEACDKQTYEYMHTHRHRSPGPSNALNAPSQSRGASPAATEGESAAESEAEESGCGETLKITLRASSLKPLTLTVRQTTKCSSIIKAFLKHHKLTDKYASSPVKGKRGKAKAPAPALVVDGDRLDPNDEINVADLEDGDMVEVVGL